jgi:SAM-dependent methyltransferase
MASREWIQRWKRQLGFSDADHAAALGSRVQELEVRQPGLETGVADLQAWNTELAGRISNIEQGSRPETDRALYLAISELRRAHEAIGDGPADGREPAELTAWELRAFSQNGEDGVLAEILVRAGAPVRSFVEFGAQSGREGNCIFLADVAGWNGVFMEADAEQFAELQRKYRAVERVTTLQAKVTPEDVQQLFERAGVPAEPAVVSIDVDGTDYWIWEALVDYRPRVVIIEYNSMLDVERRLVQPRDQDAWDGSDYFGASLGAIRALGESKGYRLVHVDLTGSNAFMVREELAEGRFPTGDRVPVRGLPNYFQSGYRHPRDPHFRRYVDLDDAQSPPRDPQSVGHIIAAVEANPKTLPERVKRIRWFHTIDLGGGIVTPGIEKTTAKKLEYIGLPEDLSGKTVLDVGAWDGFFSFECERRGAERVLATDSVMWRLETGKAGFETAREALGSRVDALEVDVMELSPQHVGGTFDIVLFLGVLYHMRDPMLALEHAASVTGERMIIETHLDMLHVPTAAMAFYPFDELAGDFSNWVGPNLLAVDGMLRASGFREVLISKPTWAAGPGAGDLHPITAQTAREWFGEAQSARAGIHAIR